MVSSVSITDFPCGYLGTLSRLLTSYSGGCQPLHLENQPFRWLFVECWGCSLQSRSSRSRIETNKIGRRLSCQLNTANAQHQIFKTWFQRSAWNFLTAQDSRIGKQHAVAPLNPNPPSFTRGHLSLEGHCLKTISLPTTTILSISLPYLYPGGLANQEPFNPMLSPQADAYYHHQTKTNKKQTKQHQ